MTDEDKTIIQPTGKPKEVGNLDNDNLEESTPASETGEDVLPSEASEDQTRVSQGVDLQGRNAYAENSAAPFSVNAQPAISHLAAGDVLKGRFEIIEVLGQGGMGMVFKALDVRKQEAKSRNPYVAIKVLNPSLVENAVLIAGLQRECEKAQELSHPNIITVYDFDRDGNYVFMSMEYLVGRPLSKIIREASTSGGIKLDRAWPIIRKMGEALAYAHRKNIVHSDFKPANVFVTDHDEVKVLDFGIASRLEHGDDDETIFDARAEGGMTPPYASFEMLNGSRADPRDDIYAFGLVVYELLTGKHPYDRKPASKVFLDQRMGQQALSESPAGLSRNQWQLLKSAIQILQEQRPPRLDEWLEQFDPKKQPKRNYAMMMGIAVILAGGGGYYIYSQQSAKEDITVESGEKAQDIANATQVPIATPIIEPPVADAGSDIQGIVDTIVLLNGYASRSMDGSPLSYAWRFIETPPSSHAVLSQPNSLSPQFTPDQAGLYRAELTVTDGNGRISQPATVSIAIAQPQPKHEITSADGTLYLAAGKPSYAIGQELTVNFHVSEAGYIRVAYVSNSGEISELLPNKYQPGKVKPGVDYKIPPKPNSFKLQVTGPTGIDKIVAVFSRSPIAKVAEIATPQGTLAESLTDLRDSSAVIQYQVVAK